MMGFKSEFEYPSQLMRSMSHKGISQDGQKGSTIALMKNGNQHTMKVPIIIPRVFTVLRSRAKASFLFASVFFSCLFSNRGTEFGVLGRGRLFLELLWTSMISRDSPSSACFTAPFTHAAGLGSTVLFQFLPSSPFARLQGAGDTVRHFTLFFSGFRTVLRMRNLAALKMRPYRTSMRIRGM